ncbi:hypothetical protein ACVRWV_10015 [Streptococcus rubneri]|nr:hypothetical protein [Streptococcus rubneri]
MFKISASETFCAKTVLSSVVAGDCLVSSVPSDSVTATVDSLRAEDNSLEPCSLNESEIELDTDSDNDTDVLSETDVDSTFCSDTDSDTEVVPRTTLSASASASVSNSDAVVVSAPVSSA